MRRARAHRHPPHLQTETALLSRSPGARSREWSSFVCMAERPNQSKHVLSRRSPPRTLRRSRWRLCPGFLRSVPFYSAVSFCCSRESGHGRLSVPHGPANERHTRCTSHSPALQERKLTAFEHACRCGASDRALRGERTSKHPARPTPCSLAKVPSSCTSRPCRLASLRPCNPSGSSPAHVQT